MAKFLVLWELDWTKIPVSPQERAKGLGALLEVVKEDLKSGEFKDWGAFDDGMAGFAIMEGSELELAIELQKWVPYVKFKTHSLLSASQVEEMLKALSQA
jgi:hypothetical protein